MNELIQGNFLDNFIKFNRQNDDNYNSIYRVISTYNLMRKYAIAERKQELDKEIK